MKLFFPKNGFYQLNNDTYFTPRESDHDRKEAKDAGYIIETKKFTALKVKTKIFHEILNIFLNLEDFLKQT